MSNRHEMKPPHVHQPALRPFDKFTYCALTAALFAVMAAMWLVGPGGW